MSDLLLRLVLPFVGCLALLFAAAWFRGARARRAAALFAAGGVGRFAVLAWGDHPYPRSPTAAVLHLHGGRAHLELEGAVANRTTLPAGPLAVGQVRAERVGDHLPARRDGGDWVVIGLGDGADARMRLAVSEEEVEPLVGVLTATPALTGPAVAMATPGSRRWHRRIVPVWSLVLGAVSLAGALVVGASWWASTPVVVTVTGAADEYAYCPVVWADPWDGRPQDAQISCWRDEPGDTIDGLALAWPLRGNVFDTDTFPVLAALPPLLAIVAAAGPLWRRYGPAPDHRLWRVAPAWSVLLAAIATAARGVGSRRAGRSVPAHPGRRGRLRSAAARRRPDRLGRPAGRPGGRSVAGRG